MIKKEAFDEKLAELKTKLQAPQDFQEEKKLEDEKKENQTNIEIIKHFLQSFDYKQINDLCAKLDETEKNIKVLEKQIQEKEELVAHQEKYQQEKIQIETTITQLQEQQKSLDLQQQEVAKKIS
ncbi:hypothetical protein IJU97_05655 [bacterium]|nr:hypothetical protein [bacterium]